MSRIESTGRYMPNKIIGNSDFRNSLSSIESIHDFFSGFDLRHHASETETGIEMAKEAVLNAIYSSEYTAEDIDLITGIILPSSHIYGDDLNLLQSKIGAKNASVLPINTGCSSFLSALNVADSLINSNKNKVVVVVSSANWVNTMLDKSENSYYFAGDGAAAFILDNKGTSLIDKYELNNSTQEIFDSMTLKNPLFTKKEEYFKIVTSQKISIYKDLIIKPILVAEKIINRNSVEINKVIFHQSGIKMMKIWAEQLNLDFNNVLHTINLYANMTASNIPVTFDYYYKDEKIKRDDILLFFSPSAGGHYIAILWRF